MANAGRKELLEEIAFLTDLLEKHENAKKEEKMKSLTAGKKCEILQHPKLNIKQPSHLSYKFTKNSVQSLTSFDQKYVNKKGNAGISDQNIVNNNFNTKYKLSKNQTSKYIFSNNNDTKRIVLDKDILSVHKKSVSGPEKESVIRSVVSCAEPINKMSHAQFMKEVKCVTELLKKENTENKLLSSVAKKGTNLQTKLSTFKNNNAINKYSACAKYNRELDRNCYAKLNSNNKSQHHVNFVPPKQFKLNKYSYKKNQAEPANSKIINMPMITVKNENNSKNILGSHVRKVTYSDMKNVSENVPSNSLTFKQLTPEKQNLTIQFNTTKCVHSSACKLSKESRVNTKCKSNSFLKIKTPGLLKTSKQKPSNTRFIKINKHLVTPKRSVQWKNVKTFSIKKNQRKLKTKYKVINKILTPNFNRKPVNSLSNSVIDKLEQDLLSMSAALTSTPLSNEITLRNYKVPQHLHVKINSSQKPKRTIKKPLKKSKKRISKYKIVNSNTPQSHLRKKEQSFANLKTCFKRVNRSRFSLVNKQLCPVLIPRKQEKSVLVKRLFKSKNAIINKNTSPTSYSAKMIKSKYLTLNKRKLSDSQNHALLRKVPSHHRKFKGYYLKSSSSHLHNKYQKIYNSKMIKKAAYYSYPLSRRQFSKFSCRNRYKRKSKSRNVLHSPVVFIHGVRYSQNSSGKTLKKLPAKGETTKTPRRRIISGKRITGCAMKMSPLTSASLANRVLNRSINRILSASTKKKLIKVNTYCMFYNRFGRCNRGVKCTYIHDPSKIAVCTRFLKGTCKIDQCPFSHEIAPGKMAICSFFLVGTCENENCPYRHEKLLPGAALCKAFVQGYCPNGKECKKAHILICPQYVQGDCDKGNSCAFPHPPKKEKKIVQKGEDNDEKKSDDVLLENVSRYFLQNEDCFLNENETDENNVVNQFVPKRRRIEEQPSFIPLFDSPSCKN